MYGSGVIESDAAKLVRLLAEYPELQARVRDFNGDGGFMFGFDESLPDDLRATWDVICSEVDDSGHSGASFSMVCRLAQRELKHGSS